MLLSDPRRCQFALRKYSRLFITTSSRDPIQNEVRPSDALQTIETHRGDLVYFLAHSLYTRK